MTEHNSVAATIEKKKMEFFWIDERKKGGTVAKGKEGVSPPRPPLTPLYSCSWIATYVTPSQIGPLRDAGNKLHRLR